MAGKSQTRIGKISKVCLCFLLCNIISMFFYLLEWCICSVYTAYGHEAALARTFVDDIFGGVLVSTVTCNECNSVSLVRLPYMVTRILKNFILVLCIVCNL